MANYNIDALTSAPSAGQQVATDKVRIASTVDIFITSGAASNTLASNASPLVLAGSVERSFYVGANNYVSLLAVASNGTCSITELGTDGVL